MPLKEESERALQADDEGQACDKKNLHRKQIRSIRSQVRHLSGHIGGNILNTIIGRLTFPMARRALSKNSTIPKKRKNTPNPVSPIPISVDFKKEE